MRVAPVVTTEPLADGHVFHEIIALPVVILTPHVAWAGAEATHSLTDQVPCRLTPI